MDADLIFYREVLDKYEIDKTLTPKNLGNGELENVALSDLRQELDGCFSDLKRYTFKEKLIDYLEDYLIRLRVVNITSKKHKVKRLKKSINKLENQYPNLDVNIDKEEVVFEEISNQKWKLQQEEYILGYLYEQQFFIRNWVFKKRNELEIIAKEDRQFQLEMKSIIHRASIKKKKVKIPKFLDYCEVGSLFAQGFISKDKEFFYYKEERFERKTELVKYIKAEVLKANKSVRQYVEATLNEKGQKDFYNSKGMMKKIIEYCKYKNIIITSEFQSKYNDLIN